MWLGKKWSDTMRRLNEELEDAVAREETFFRLLPYVGPVFVTLVWLGLVIGSLFLIFTSA